MPDPATPADVRDLLESARHVAVLGAHPVHQRPAFYVPHYLHNHGYHLHPVNPKFVGEAFWGRPVVATLAALDTPIDVVDVFRRADQVPLHLDDILAMSPRPGAVWLQLGVRNDPFAEALRARGIRVIQDRCMLADHRALGLGATRQAVP